MSAEILVDDVIYKHYRSNRELFPQISPHQWGHLFDQWQWLEQRYQEEKA